MKAKILVIIGSASKESSNAKLMEEFAELSADDFQLTVFTKLGLLPHFDPSLTEDLPVAVTNLITCIEAAQGVVICSPEYIFSIPARLKNLLEWCVATTVFLDKPVGLVTASADGQQGHAQLKLIMKTLGACLAEEAELVINGIKGRFDGEGRLSDKQVRAELVDFTAGFKKIVYD
ncbi:NAD(P)H-dependent oxidoreductase [Pedobacter sp. ASV1-7]|uniref:NADPH-dependent FMN reductase n=1 Tax=Pedobacter sp. ASV1-7 TaxID=3145237 RepID=UPI0032E8A95A